MGVAQLAMLVAEETGHMAAVADPEAFMGLAKATPAVPKAEMVAHTAEVAAA